LETEALLGTPGEKKKRILLKKMPMAMNISKNSHHFKNAAS
jgi:hypothetical protein